jgi:hypothetical protein
VDVLDKPHPVMTKLATMIICKPTAQVLFVIVSPLCKKGHTSSRRRDWTGVVFSLAAEKAAS